MVRKKKRQVKVPAVKNTSLRQVIPIYNMEKMDISIVIPAYNEESRIIPTLEKVYRYFKNRQIDFEIIVVDDGSKDNTVQAVKQWQMAHSFSSPSFLLPSPLRGEGQGEGENERIRIISHPTNKGKGAAVRTGVLAARGNLILFTDADLSTPIEEFTKLKKTIDEGYDIAIGSRGLSDSRIEIHQPEIREIIGKLFNLFVRFVFRLEFKDTQCGFKIFKSERAYSLFEQLNIYGFVFDVEVLLRAKYSGLKVKEVPVLWINKKQSSISLLFTPGSIVKEIIRLFMMDMN
jgi:dolichyl-phosphate beta-glucosyltransferase